MKSLQRLAFIGNHLPRLCGIATFTHDLHRAVSLGRPRLETGIVAMTDSGGHYVYPEAVRLEVQEDKVSEYRAAADFLNNAGYDAVSLQHEYGIFGGHSKLPHSSTQVSSGTRTRRGRRKMVADSS